MDTAEESAVAEVNTEKNNNHTCDCETEQAATSNLADEGSSSERVNVNATPINKNGMQASSTAAGFPAIGETPASSQPCQVNPEEQMELGESLHFENLTVAIHNGNPGESQHESILFPQTSAKILGPSEEELKDSSSGDSSSDRLVILTEVLQNVHILEQQASKRNTKVHFFPPFSFFFPFV